MYVYTQPKIQITRHVNTKKEMKTHFLLTTGRSGMIFVAVKTYHIHVDAVGVSPVVLEALLQAGAELLLGVVKGNTHAYVHIHAHTHTHIPIHIHA